MSAAAASFRAKCVPGVLQQRERLVQSAGSGALAELQPGWPRWHATGMGGSYIALLTGSYVDSGPQLPLWNRLPHWMYWIIPTEIGVPLIWWALRRFHAGVSSGPRVAARSAAPPIPQR